MRYFDDETFRFLRDLKRHNDRDWFSKNKDRYERSVKEPMLQFIEDAGPELRTISPSIVADSRPSGGSMFRIHRDIRFSRDKSPYKPYVAAHFSPLKGTIGPGYYLHIEPKGSIVVGGMWMPDPPVLQSIRERIATRPAEWKKVRTGLDHDEGALTRPPRGFSPDDPMIEDIKRKSFTSSTRLGDDRVMGSDFLKTFVRDCRRISPLMSFLAAAAGARW
jgi:uncharacterized protein (TIGR02453 family)